jgi:hypothetical protein
MGWGCCLPPGCFPAAAPQAFLCGPSRTRLGGPQTALSRLGCGFFDPQGFADRR